MKRWIIKNRQSIIIFLSIILSGIYYRLRRVSTQTDSGSAIDSTRYAIAVKTGESTLFNRVPILLETCLKPFQQILFIGDTDGLKIGDFPVFNILQNLHLHLDGFESKPLTQQSERSQIIPDKESDGWRLDAHKNIPGFKLLYETFNHADWFIMIDDDTYLSSQNLFNFLNQYDPNVPYYFGFAHTATGCDNVWDMKKSILFAHGGSGIVLSRGTLKKMDSHWDKCIERYKNCWAGDVRVSLCLRDLNIFLTDNRNFHSEPPNENVYFSDACARPITFHHLLPHQTQALYNIETNSEVFNLAAVLNTFRIPNISFGTIRRGSDYKAVYAPDLNHCVVLCQYENECVSWVYDLGVCWLKNSIPGVDQKKNSTSGIVFEHFKCIVDPSNPFEIGM